MHVEIYKKNCLSKVSIILNITYYIFIFYFLKKSYYPKYKNVNNNETTRLNLDTSTFSNKYLPINTISCKKEAGSHLNKKYGINTLSIQKKTFKYHKKF